MTSDRCRIVRLDRRRISGDRGARWNQYPCSVMADEIEGRHVRALLVLGGNPIVAIPDTARMRAALRSLDLLVAWDVVPTATTELATHVLACVDWFERPDVIGATSTAQPAVFSQYTRARVPPSAERKPLWWSFAQLGRRIRIDAMPAGLDPDTATDDDVLATVTGQARVSLDELRAADGPVVVAGAEYGWVRRSGHAPDRPAAPGQRNRAARGHHRSAGPPTTMSGRPINAFSSLGSRTTNTNATDSARRRRAANASVWVEA
jgi:anaerobic selenocysteine-containing dehydrogenase